MITLSKANEMVTAARMRVVKTRAVKPWPQGARSIFCWAFSFFGLASFSIAIPTVCAEPPPAAQASAPWERLADGLAPYYEILAARADTFAVRIEGTVRIKDRDQPLEIRVSKFDNDSFDFSATHPDYAVEVYRRKDVTAMVIPKHERAFVGTGNVSDADNLAPLGMSTRLSSTASHVSSLVHMIQLGNIRSIMAYVEGGYRIKEGKPNRFDVGTAATVTLDPTGDAESPRVKVEAEEHRFTISIEPLGAPADPSAWEKFEQVQLERSEIEMQLSRGIRRAWEVLLPSLLLTTSRDRQQQVPHGELRYANGQRLVILNGTPEQVGKAHGQLLANESQRCIDSVLHMFGSIQTIATGRWFRHDLAAAYARLKPHIPQDHITETRALASALGHDPELLEQLNVFPELFHCSGFAVFDSATVDGKLYHGRVLDYMTTIGLQDAATTFIVSIDGKIPFANIGYAGFTGSVSGMNARKVSLGEMGGAGEGQWDGVPMATLMRRALEECGTLDEVVQLWTDSPRTCEYYYVFADGKTNDAVGVAATPENLEIVPPGTFHERLGDGIADAVVLSAGSRLETLRQRVTENHGKIDADKAMWLMSRPVAMESNLHNVLFVPADLTFYVANADHSSPAAERPYVRYVLGDFVVSPGTTELGVLLNSTEPQVEP